METKMTKVGTDHVDEIIIADTTGNALASGVKIGSDTMKSSPDHITVATEKAISDYISNSVVLKSNVSTSATLAADINTASDEKPITEKGLFTLIQMAKESMKSNMAEDISF